MDDEVAEKIARNNAAFRVANNGIKSAAARLGLGDDAPVPFLCECSDRSCVEIIRLTLVEYERVRSNPRWFAHAVDHEVQIAGAVAPVEKHSGYVVVEKIALAGEVATRLEREGDPG